MHTRFIASVLLGATLLLGGCAGFRSNNLQEVGYDKLQTSTDTRTKVFSQWRLENMPTNEMTNAAYKRQFDDVISRSDCCTLVGTAEEADVVVDGKTFGQSNPAAGLAAVLSGFTFTVIPCWTTLDLRIAADVSRGDTNRSYDVRDSGTMVIWLPMIVAMPFAENPIKMEKEINENVYKNLVLKMKNDGLI